MASVLSTFRPDWVLVQGDTTTTLAAALSAFYQKIPVAHVEAGLRTGNIYSPWPEEMNRKITTQIASVHFAPTETARSNLLAEGVPSERVIVTGNTVIDALMWTRNSLLGDAAQERAIASNFGFLTPDRKLILVTGHRRENFDGGLERVFEALSRVACRPDVQIVFPVHLNPIVQAAASKALAGLDNVHLIAPQPYKEFVWLMNRSHLIVTDSGGVQEEAPSLGKPVLVTRDTTERPEAVDAGTVALVGTDPQSLTDMLLSLLDDPQRYSSMAEARNPYGDGNASARILKELLSRR
jgi:UDP-N-acetylglucosamine 2-epimerase (non-hydrolysing)